jgi:lysophospholipase L1-like esterase
VFHVITDVFDVITDVFHVITDVFHVISDVFRVIHVCGTRRTKVWHRPGRPDERSTRSKVVIPMTRLTIILTFVLTLFISSECVADTRAVLTFGSSHPPLNYLVLGDSTAAGVGADYQSGIAVMTAKELSRTHTVHLLNLGVSGARIADVRADQLPLIGAFVPDVVLLSVAANDVIHLTRIESMRTDLRAIIHALRMKNPSVTIVATGSPDMGSPPRIPRLLRGLAARRARNVNVMFREEAATDHITVAPIAEVTGPLFRKDRSLFADDRFHPNARGYATWIAVLNEALATAMSPAAARRP